MKGKRKPDPAEDDRSAKTFKDAADTNIIAAQSGGAVTMATGIEEDIAYRFLSETNIDDAPSRGPVAIATTPCDDIAERFLSELIAPFNRDMAALTFLKPIEYVYNPLVYASEPHECYIRRYCNTTKEILFLGMNPGPFGMAQNGVPFGEYDSVNNFLGIRGNVGKPPREHPKRLIVGLSCKRKEVSGNRFWGLWKALCKTPEAFFHHAFVYNHCGLVFMSETGKNITPADMPAAIRKQLVEICDAFVCKMVRLLQVKTIVGIGKFAERRAKLALKAEGLEGVRVVQIMHPSPINPAANKGWDTAVTKQLEDLDLLKYFTGT